ncbi:hypothetical protein FRB91_000516 [Serendipita sp. 411]|nr:hypothetical protein FRC18_009103 [Serendipita sp. 400]KAG8846720.1 hypothetical protein FRB91_000516 [Serendipita sp. 411]
MSSIGSGEYTFFDAMVVDSTPFGIEIGGNESTTTKIHANIRSTLTEHEPTDPEADGETTNKRPRVTKRKREEYEAEEPSTAKKAIIDAGYTFEDHVFESGFPHSYPFHDAGAPNGSSVMVKCVRRGSNETKILKYLKECGGPAHHIIELLDVIPFEGSQLIVLHELVPLFVLGIRMSLNSSIVSSLQTQFLEGVEYLHEHGVAHMSLSPGDVVLDLKKQKNPPILFITNFDSAVRVKGVDTMCKSSRVDGEWWIAPEVSNEHEYSAILADRWSCGRTFEFFRTHMVVPPLNEELSEEISRKLMDVNPTLRPVLRDCVTLSRRIELGQV